MDDVIADPTVWLPNAYTLMEEFAPFIALVGGFALLLMFLGFLLTLIKQAKGAGAAAGASGPRNGPRRQKSIERHAKGRG